MPPMLKLSGFSPSALWVKLLLPLAVPNVIISSAAVNVPPATGAKFSMYSTCRSGAPPGSPLYDSATRRPLGVVRVRYRRTSDGAIREIEHPIAVTTIASSSFSRTRSSAASVLTSALAFESSSSRRASGSTSRNGRTP